MKDLLEALSTNLRTVILVLVILLGAVVITRALRWIITKSFATASDKLNMDATRYRFLKNAVSLIVWVVALAAIIYLIPQLRALAITMFAGAGILMAIIGFAAQQAFSNIISGIFIVMFKPFRVGDIIRVGTQNYGQVEDITLRHTVILNFENQRVIIPNSVISSETVINDSIGDARVCRHVELGISYDSDIDLATTIMQEEASNHPSCMDARTAEELELGLHQVMVRVIGFGDSSVNLRAYVWASDTRTAIQMHSDLNKAIKKRFDAEGIEIPFPYRTIVYKNQPKS